MAFPAMVPYTLQHRIRATLHGKSGIIKAKKMAETTTIVKPEMLTRSHDEKLDIGAPLA
jgi:hypothetical protein